MSQPVTTPETSQGDETKSDDIESELCGSAREVSFGFVPFANLDLAAVVRMQVRPTLRPCP